MSAHRDELIRERDIPVSQRDEGSAHRDDLIRQRDIALSERYRILAQNSDIALEPVASAMRATETAAERHLSYRPRSRPPKPGADPAVSR